MNSPFLVLHGDVVITICLPLFPNEKSLSTRKQDFPVKFYNSSAAHLSPVSSVQNLAVPPWEILDCRRVLEPSCQDPASSPSSSVEDISHNLANLTQKCSFDNCSMSDRLSTCRGIIGGTL